jgi:hypothetical protein
VKTDLILSLIEGGADDRNLLLSYQLLAFIVLQHRFRLRDQFQKGQSQGLGKSMGRIQTRIDQAALNQPSLRLVEPCPLRQRLPKRGLQVSLANASLRARATISSRSTSRANVIRTSVSKVGFRNSFSTKLSVCRESPALSASKLRERPRF